MLHYANFPLLLFSEDHGINGEEVALNYGYYSLPHFLRSAEMALRISTHNEPNGVVYKGIPNETNAHLREAHQISSESHAAQIVKYVFSIVPLSFFKGRSGLQCEPMMILGTHVRLGT